MENIFQFLLVLGIIGFAVVRQALKTNAQKSANQPPPVYVPDEQEDYPEMMFDSPPPPPSSTDTVQQFKAKQKKSVHTGKPREVEKSPLHETESISQEFNIHSDDEVRKGIIWSEILTRKY